MATFVLVHGGGTGGHEWRNVAQLLRAADHDVYTPTLTGLGERVHLLHPNIDLDLHIQDIVNVLTYEDLRDVILLGYSYSGMVITGVADCVPDRLAHLVYLDAYIPDDGQSIADIAGPERMAVIDAVVQAQGEGWYLPVIPPLPGRTPQPYKTLTQPVRLQNPTALTLPRTFIACTENDPSWTFTAMLHRLGASARAKGWRYREIAMPHWSPVPKPQALADLLVEIPGEGQG